MPFQPCAVIPSHNHYGSLPVIVTRLREHGLPVFIIDDASDGPARSALAALASPKHGITLHRLQTNQGKGGAVIAGLELAAAAGFTHALQIDADGQHDLTALPDFLAQGRAHPDAIIIGAPIYNSTMPIGRRIGRWITHFWVRIETLMPTFLDSMCGFRVYPLAQTMPLLRQERVGRRMDFDPEILVRLIWRGVRPIAVSVRVNYPEGNISNYHMLRDNWAITWMHTRLVLGMLRRLSSILRGRRVARSAPHHWARLGERGAYWGLRLLATVYYVLGRRGCMVLLFPVALYFHITGAQQRHASRDFLRQAFAARGEPREPGLMDTLRHFINFARKTLETFATWTGVGEQIPVDIADAAEVECAFASQRGLLLIVSHLGNVELSRAALGDERRARLTVLVHTRHARNYARLLERFQPQATINTLQVTEVDPATIMALQARIESGGWLAIAGDRTPVQSAARTSRVSFLGSAASFPQGPYLLAHFLDCPVYLMFCQREQGRYRLYFERFAGRISLPRRGREEALAEWTSRYARRLEAFCLRDPFQWYNFYDFWAPGPDKAETR